MPGNGFGSVGGYLRNVALLAMLLDYFLLSSCVKALECYDSFVRGSPAKSSSCGPGQVCFSEFYALSEQPESTQISEWYVDRFCVYRQQCQMRGIGPGCVTVEQLDKMVRRTFRKKLEHHVKDGWKRLLHTRFCCCESDYCNRLDISELNVLYNVTDRSLTRFAAF
ncbi:unnamed protein product [Bursaphelenchus okinawaensis]|uniref:DUF7773 domain-containing protein n=1 Tax=Bursaphelenchus okinawaensis TaxID=465554 RepID=A0A811KS48_9BILA|nr:unnamed protein product [Bursaphelenchus okinawaensis]CAG9109301.1 unnamed protein product [Bursaphelenchus okinawaensis]